jgi:hypothetical protein
MACLPKIAEQETRDVFYSIGIDKTQNLKERIAEVNGINSEPMKAVAELDKYVSDPETRKSSWYRGFYKRVKSAMWVLYPHVKSIDITQMTHEFIDEIFNGGYIRVLQSLAVESGPSHVCFAAEYANCCSVPLGAVLLFGPRGGANTELLHFMTAEKSHGMHRPGTFPNPYCSEQTRKAWYNAGSTANWPSAITREGEFVAVNVPEEQRQEHLSEGVTDDLREMWRRNPTLRDYTGTNRLSGDISYHIIEDVVDMLVQKRLSPLNELQKARYDKIVEDANKQGIDPFYAVYKTLFVKRKGLRSLWNEARKWLYDYSILLWEAQNELWSVQNRLLPASGIVFRARESSISRSTKKAVPGTIYLNNGRYYWTVARKMKPRPLIDPRNKPEVPGSFIVNNSRYYWWIPGWVKRRRLVPKGERFSTKNKATALKIARQLWTEIKKKNPELAAKVHEHTRINGIATKDRAIATKVAAKLWKEIQRKDPELAAKILKDNRPKAKDHWYAQIVVGQKHRFLGSFETRAEAEAAYAAEFEKVWGYPPGYNVKIIPKLDKVWPTWAEERAHLDRMDENPRMPVIGQPAQAEPLVFMIERMKKIRWLAKHLILVFDDNSPVASSDIAVQSRGERWYREIKKQANRMVIRGSVSLDNDTGRIRITLYNQSFSDSRVLAEEIYHIAFKIIRHSSPEILEAIQRWYRNQLRKGADPTFSMSDMFSCSMAMEGSGTRSGLPINVVKSARKILSSANGVSDSVMHQVKICWSMI